MTEASGTKHQPHPPLSPHYQTLDEKQSFLRDVFDRSAPYYEGIASWGFFGTEVGIGDPRCSARG